MEKLTGKFAHGVFKPASLVCGGMAAVLGFVVLFGWYTHNHTLIQVFPSFVPMQYNTALGFFLCGGGLILMLLDRKRLGAVFGGLAGLIGVLTLLQYISGLDFKIDQLLMEHYVTVETSHPGRMAPNTALCFFLTGSGILVMAFMEELKKKSHAAGLLGSIIVALGLVAFFGYLSGVKTAYGWGEMTRMAVHTALGFVFLGTGLVMTGWRTGTIKGNRMPDWMAVTLGIGIVTLSLVFWQALKADAHTPTYPSAANSSIMPEVVLGAGLVLAILLTLTIRLYQKLWRRAKEVEQSNLELESEIKKREVAEKERTTLEEQLHHTQKMEAIGTLAGGISHDFNNILSIISGYTELSLEKAQTQCSADDVENLEQVLKAVKRAKELVKQILAFSRKDEEKRSTVYLSEMVTEVLKMMKSTLPSTIRIESNIDSELGPVSANSAQIHQVLVNLCTNAAHAMKNRGGKLEVTLREIDIEPGAFTLKTSHTSVIDNLKVGRFQQLSVSDTGHGMNAKTLKRIFEPYFTTKDVGEGSGIGLPVVHGIIKQHGGEILVYSQPGKGSTFHVFIPVNGEMEIYSPADGSEEQLEPVQGGEERILLVDDEKELIELEKKWLTGLGYDVETRNDSVKALNDFKAGAYFDLVITDLTMPSITGDRLAIEVKRIKPGIPVILCSGFSNTITEENFQTKGIDGFLMKPFMMRHFTGAVRQVLDNNQRRPGKNQK